MFSAQRIRPSRHDRLRAAATRLLILAVAITGPALTAGPVPELYLQGDLSDDGLRIGSNLDVAIIDGEPLRRYTIMLVDEGSDPVATLVDVMTDSFGISERHRLWTRTGVEGCDPDAIHEPDLYRFASFDEADSVLDGRTFDVVLLESATSPIGAAIAERELPLTMVEPPVSAYPADSTGCFRTELIYESLHLAIRHQAPGDLLYRIFVVDAQTHWSQGQPVVDVRPSGPQLVNVPSGINPTVALLWAAPVAKGEYQVIIRDDTATTIPVFLEGDVVTEMSVSHTGTTYRECLPVCPPPRAF